MFPRRNSKVVLPEPLKRESSQAKLGHPGIAQMKRELSRTRLAATWAESFPSRHEVQKASGRTSAKGRQAAELMLNR